MINAFMGIHTGPRQFELPPNRDEDDSAGSSRPWVLLAAEIQHVRRVAVRARHRSPTARAEERVLVEEPGQDPPQSSFDDDGEHRSTVVTGPCYSACTGRCLE